MKRLELFEKLREVWDLPTKEQRDTLFKFIKRSLKVEDENLDPSIRTFISKVHKKWGECKPTKERFLKENAQWLDADSAVSKTRSDDGASVGPGHSLSFEDVSQRTKERRTQELRSSSSPEELVAAAASSLYVEGFRTKAEVVRKILSNDDPSTKTKAGTDSGKDRLHGKMYSPDEALSLMVEAKLTRHQYELLRNGALKHNGNSYPSYHKVLEVKLKCYPSEENLRVTETIVEVHLQSLLDLTTSRLLSVLDDGLHSLSNVQLQNMVLICKWCLDGSSVYTTFKQVSIDPNLDDSSLFLTCFVPLQPFAADQEKKIVWQNSRPGAPRGCRTTRMQFAKENDELIRQGTRRVEGEITYLQKFKGLYNTGREVCVSYQMHMTKVDGKVCNAVANHKATQSCYICGAKPSQMNDIVAIRRLPVRTEMLASGLSLLHAKIRSMEYLLHVAYRLDLLNWQCKSKEDKAIMEKRKGEIQRVFKTRLGLNVDKPKQGFGNTNDGNTARTFFANAEVTSEITGIDLEIIKTFYYLLTALPSGFEINVKEVSIFNEELLERCIELHRWYSVPPTVHKLLVYGAAIIEKAPLPIGLMSEDAQESRCKDHKHYRLANTRKTARILSNKDLLPISLISSDPVITALRKLPKESNTRCLPTEVLRIQVFLKDPSLTFVPTEEGEEEFDDEEN